jgi:hypothetical protein
VVNQVVMSFHACGGNVGDSVNIPLPNWVKSIGEEKDLFYKDAHDNPSIEYLSWAVDQRPVLKDQYGHRVSPLQVINWNEICFGLSFCILNGAHPCEQDHCANQGSLNFSLEPVYITWSTEWGCWDVAWHVYKNFLKLRDWTSLHNMV